VVSGQEIGVQTSGPDVTEPQTTNPQ
jgi:hypothetical protein